MGGNTTTTQSGLGFSQQDPAFRRAPPQVSPTATSRPGQSRHRRSRLTWNDVHLGAGRSHQRKPRTRVLGRAVQGARQAHAAIDDVAVYEIVGVVGNERQDGATKPSPTMIYWTMLNGDKADPRGIYVQRSMAYAIRSSRLQSPGFLGEVQQAVWSVNPNLPLARVRTMLQVYNESMAQTQFVLVILGIAASVTLLLACSASTA